MHVGRYRRTAEADTFEARRCSRTVIHPDWSFSTSQHDIALCFLNASSSLPPAALPGISADRVPLQDGRTELQVLGWGAQREGGG